VSLRSR
jgi:hypothetical protein